MENATQPRLPPRFATCRQRLQNLSLQITLPSYNTFRYGMITLYVGSLLMVIGYHNPYIAFTRILGCSMAIIGFSMVMTAFIKSCKSLNNNDQSQPSEANLDTISHRVESADSKLGLPTYDMAVDTELPTYEEAQALSTVYCKPLNPAQTPPPAWSPPTLETFDPSTDSCAVTIHCDTVSSPILLPHHHNPPVYQIFGRSSPNRVQPIDHETSLSPAAAVPSSSASIFFASSHSNSPEPEMILTEFSPTQRRRSLISERPRTSTSAIVKSYSSSSFESLDEDCQDSDWDEDSPEGANKPT